MDILFYSAGARAKGIAHTSYTELHSQLSKQYLSRAGIFEELGRDDITESHLTQKLSSEVIA